MPESWIVRHRLLSYYVLAVGITIAVMATRFVVPGIGDVIGPMITYFRREHLATSLVSIIRYAILEQPWAWLICVFAAAPTIAALVISAIQGRRATRRLVRRLLPWGSRADRGRAVRFYLIAFALSGVVMAWYYWMGTRYGAAAQLAARDETIGQAPLFIATWLFLSHFTDEGGTLEELGWRGFALPVLLERNAPLRASVWLGTIWMLWHLPREIPGLLGGSPLWPFLEGQLGFLALTIALSILCTSGFLETGGSVIPGIIIHGGSNVWNKALAAPLDPGLSWPVDPRMLIVGSLAIVVIVLRWRQFTTAPSNATVTNRAVAGTARYSG